MTVPTICTAAHSTFNSSTRSIHAVDKNYKSESFFRVTALFKKRIHNSAAAAESSQDSTALFSDLCTAFLFVKKIDFKILLLIFVFKALDGLGTKYMSDPLLCYEPSRPLRLSRAGLLSVPQSGN